MSRRKARFGHEVPRLWTPPLRELTPETSLGFACIEFAHDVCGIELFPWQKWLLVHALELAGDLTVSTMNQRKRLEPLFRFRRVVVLVARQNGKSLLSQVLSLFFLYVLGVDLILGTAQDLDTAEEVWDGVLEIIEETPELKALADKPVLNNGKKAIRLKTGERYKVKAANRRAGRGLSGDLILLDELREHQSWDAYAAITKTTQARAAALIWAMSNAGDASSVVLRALRMMAHAELGDPDGINAAEASDLMPDEVEIDGLLDLSDGQVGAADLTPEDFELEPGTLGLFEWSAPPGCNVLDRDGWAMANPSMGYGISEATIAGDARTEGLQAITEWVFRTEVLCQWPDGTIRGPFPSGSWDKTLNRVVEAADGSKSLADADRMLPPFRACIDTSKDRSRTYIALAGRRADGVAQVEIAKAALGDAWVKDWLTERAGQIEMVTGQTNGADVSPLMESLTADLSFPLHVEPWSGRDLTAAFALTHDAIRDGKLRHNPQPVLDTSAHTAVVKVFESGGKVVDRKRSPGDAAPLTAFIGAFWLLGRKRPMRQPTPMPVSVEPELIGSTAAEQSVATMGF